MAESNHSQRWRRLFAGAAVVAISPLLASEPTTAAPAEEHCVVEVTGQEADGRYVTSAPRCYGSYRSMLASVDVYPRSRSEDAGVLAQEAVASSVPLATHYENFNLGGSSITIWGTTCSGGYTNLAQAWRNRISSTESGCGTVRHFDLLNMAGISQDTGWPWGNLVALNNKAESIQYL